MADEKGKVKPSEACQEADRRTFRIGTSGKIGAIGLAATLILAGCSGFQSRSGADREPAALVAGILTLMAVAAVAGLAVAVAARQDRTPAACLLAFLAVAAAVMAVAGMRAL